MCGCELLANFPVSNALKKKKNINQEARIKTVTISISIFNQSSCKSGYWVHHELWSDQSRSVRPGNETQQSTMFPESPTHRHEHSKKLLVCHKWGLSYIVLVNKLFLTKILPSVPLKADALNIARVYLKVVPRGRSTDSNSAKIFPKAFSSSLFSSSLWLGGLGKAACTLSLAISLLCI